MLREGRQDSVPGLDSVLTDALELVPGSAASLYTPDLEPGSPHGFWLAEGMPPAMLGDYMAKYRDLDPWARAAARRGPAVSGTVLDTDRLVPPAQLVRSEFHDAFLRPFGIARCLVGVVDDGRGLLPRTRLTVIRAAAEPAFSEGEIAGFRVLTRLARAMLALSIECASAARSLLLQQSTVDLIRMPVLIVDAERRIGMMNSSARTMIRAAGPITERGGRMHAREPRFDRALGDALARAATGGGTRLVRLAAGRPGVRAPALLVSAFAVEGAGGGAAVLARVLQPEVLPEGAEAVLGLVLDLTPPETAVALGLAEGLSHDEIARRRGVKVTTVRTTLRRLQEKLCVDRSGTLARLIQSIVAVGGLRL